MPARKRSGLYLPPGHPVIDTRVLRNTVTVMLLLSLGCGTNSEHRSVPAPADDSGLDGWPDGFTVRQVVSPFDGVPQNVVVRKSTASEPMPLLMVLHTWSGDYAQRSGNLAAEAEERNWNYIHPDFRGPNQQPDACCSDAALADLDAAVSWAVDSMQVDERAIHVVGSSGGGYATLCMLMRSRHRVASYSAWVPIVDLETWYHESRIRGNRYHRDIMSCTASTDTLDTTEARRRSPLYWPVPAEKLEHTVLQLFAGIRDGYDGSVPISHSLLFYNKVAGEMGARQDRLVDTREMANLLTAQWTPHQGADALGDRAILFERSHENVSVTIFDGGHEMLDDLALDLLPITP